MKYSMALKKIIIGACVLMFTTSALAQRDARRGKGGIQTKNGMTEALVNKEKQYKHSWHNINAMKALHGHAADINWGFNPLNVGPYLSGSARCVDRYNANGNQIFPFVQSSQQPWSYSSFASYVTSQSSYVHEAEFRRSLDMNGSLGFNIKDILGLEFDGGHSESSELLHGITSSQNSVDFIFSAKALGPTYIGAGDARVRTDLVEDVVEAGVSNSDRTNLWLQKCGIGYIDQVRLGAYLRVVMHIRSSSVETQVSIAQSADNYFNASANQLGGSGGSASSAQGFLNSLNASFSYNSSEDSIVATTTSGQTFSITFDITSEGPFFDTGAITSLSDVWDLFDNFEQVVESVNKKHLAAMHYSAKPYNSVTNISQLVYHDGVATGIDYDDMAEVNMRMVMQDDIGELILNYDFERSKLNYILDDYMSLGAGVSQNYEFWNTGTLNDILENVSDDEQIAAAAARTLYCLADFTEDALGCHYQTLTDAFGFDHNFDFWNSWGIPLAPYYQAPRRVGVNSVMTGVAYYNWIKSQGTNNYVVEVDGDSSFSIYNSGNSKKFSCLDETFWQTDWEQCVGPILSNRYYNPGWSVQTHLTDNTTHDRRKFNITQYPTQTKLHLDIGHKKSSSAPAVLSLDSATLTGPYNWGWATLTPANAALEALQ
ncbi:MAG: hypothetical protein HOK97_20300 [Deltaproteobacteria bacterium]|nr:hypothetical protein [Deltaproteobacteria bacterium]MBT6492125.1 hypothetical protein [Deltaproteobacteria bacterium]